MLLSENYETQIFYQLFCSPRKSGGINTHCDMRQGSGKDKLSKDASKVIICPSPQKKSFSDYPEQEYLQNTANLPSLSTGRRACITKQSKKPAEERYVLFSQPMEKTQLPHSLKCNTLPKTHRKGVENSPEVSPMNNCFHFPPMPLDIISGK